MGDDSPIEVNGKGRVELLHESFEDVLHVPKHLVNLLSVYQITHSSTRKRVEFTLDAVNIHDLHSSSKIATGEVNNGAKLYTFSEFIESKSSLLLTHANDSSRLWHKRFGHLNYRYIQQLSKHEMVEGLPNISFSRGLFEGCVLGKYPREKFDTSKTHRASSPLYLIHSDLMGPFPHHSINKVRTHESLLILVLYVDDLLITGSFASAIATVKRALHERFLMMDMGPLHFFLGLEGTITFRIHYATGTTLNLLGFTYFDWVSDKTDRMSTSGYLLSLGSGPICWLSKKQVAIALSSAKAKYRGLVNITIQALWLQHFLTELGVQFHQPTIIWCDNQSTLKFCRDLVQ
eukprot:PITA_24704